MSNVEALENRIIEVKAQLAFAFENNDADLQSDLALELEDDLRFVYMEEELNNYGNFS